MADDRPADESIDQLAKLQADFEDFRTTSLARMARCATGTVEIALLGAAKADTLVLNGQTVSRTTYANLWQWVQDNALTGSGRFGTGDGSTTFSLPDYQGKFLVGVGTEVTTGDVYTVGQSGGATLKTLSTANLPAHAHTGSTSDDTHSHGSSGDHGHSGGSSNAGNHGGHLPADNRVAQAGGDWGLAVWNAGGSGNGDHSHSMSINNNGSHTHPGDTHNHTLTLNNTGSGTAFDARPVFKAVSLLIWT